MPDTLPESFGRYRILKKLGEGGMGAVYLAHDTQMDRSVALKVPRFDKREADTVIAQFYREARIVAKILHPNVCPVFDVGAIDGTHFLTMAFIEGTPLADAIYPEQPWPVLRALELVRYVAAGLHELHQHGIVHRDLKPGNILLKTNGEPVLLDFGLARSLVAESQQLAEKSAMQGTPAYMAPEQMDGRPQQIKPWTDVYALGAILYELLTSQRPFQPGSLVQLCAQVMHAERPRPSQSVPGITPALDQLCLDMLAIDPAQRPADMAQFLTRLNLCQNELVGPSKEGVVTQCPKCGKPVRILDKMASKRVLCPACRTPLAAATSRSLTRTKQLTGAAEMLPVPEPLSDTLHTHHLVAPRPPATNRIRMVMMVAVIGLVGSMGGFVGWLLLATGSTPATIDSPRWSQGPSPLVTAPRLDKEGGPQPPLPPDPGKAPSKGAWYGLCNEKDLNGWVSMRTLDDQATNHQRGESGWTAADGEIVCGGGKAGWLRSARQYSDFVLTLEFQFSEAKGNSGIYVRTPEQGDLASAGLEIQLLGDNGKVEPAYRTGAIWGVVGPTEAVPTPLGKWNQLYVRCEGEEIEIALNGVRVVSTRMSAHGTLQQRPRTGYLGLSNWKQEAVGVKFRRVFVCDLTDQGPTPALPAALLAGPECVSIATWENQGPKRRSIAFSPDGRQALIGNADGSLGYFDVASGQPIQTWTGAGRDVFAVSFAPDGSRGVVNTGTTAVIVWDLHRLKKETSLDEGTSAVRDAAFAPDGRHVLVASDGFNGDAGLRYWDTRTGVVKPWRGHASPVFSVGFAADGKRAISGDYGGTVFVWDVATGRHVLELAKLPGHLSSVGLSKEGTMAFTAGPSPGGSRTDMVRVWSIKDDTARETRKVPGTWFAVSSDGKRLVSNGDGPAAQTLMIELESPPGGAPFRPIAKLDFTPTARALSPDGQLLLLGGPSGQLLLWRLPKR